MVTKQKTKSAQAKAPQKVSQDTSQKTSQEISRESDPAAYGRLVKERYYDAKKLVRSLEKKNDRYIYLLTTPGSAWLQAIEASALFYRTLSDQQIELARQKLLDPISASEVKHMQKSSLKPVRVLPDRDSRLCSRYTVSIHGEEGFLHRMEGVAVKRIKPPKDFEGYIVVYQLPNPFSREEIKNMFGEEDLLRERLEFIVYGKNPDKELLKLVREIMSIAEHAATSTRINHVFQSRLLGHAMDLMAKFYMYAKYASTDKQQLASLMEMMAVLDQLLIDIDICCRQSAFDYHLADELGVKLSKLSEKIICKVVRIDPRLVDHFKLYQELKS